MNQSLSPVDRFTEISGRLREQLGALDEDGHAALVNLARRLGPPREDSIGALAHTAPILAARLSAVSRELMSIAATARVLVMSADELARHQVLENLAPRVPDLAATIGEMITARAQATAAQ